MSGWFKGFSAVDVPGGMVVLALFASVHVLSTAPAVAQQQEDPVLALVDSRNATDAPADAVASGGRLVMSNRGDVLTFTVPSHCAAWPVGSNGAKIAMACANKAWPKLNGVVTIRLDARRAAVPASRSDPDWAGLPPPHGQYVLQAREALSLGDHSGNVEAYCDNHWFYCTEVGVDGDLFGSRTELRFVAKTWDGSTAVALGHAIVTASSFEVAVVPQK